MKSRTRSIVTKDGALTRRLARAPASPSSAPFFAWMLTSVPAGFWSDLVVQRRVVGASTVLFAAVLMTIGLMGDIHVRLTCNWLAAGLCGCALGWGVRQDISVYDRLGWPAASIARVVAIVAMCCAQFLMIVAAFKRGVVDGALPFGPAIAWVPLAGVSFVLAAVAVRNELDGTAQAWRIVEGRGG